MTLPLQSHSLEKECVDEINKMQQSMRDQTLKNKEKERRKEIPKKRKKNSHINKNQHHHIEKNKKTISKHQPNFKDYYLTDTTNSLKEPESIHFLKLPPLPKGANKSDKKNRINEIIRHINAANTGYKLEDLESELHALNTDDLLPKFKKSISRTLSGEARTKFKEIQENTPKEKAEKYNHEKSKLTIELIRQGLFFAFKQKKPSKQKSKNISKIKKLYEKLPTSIEGHDRLTILLEKITTESTENSCDTLNITDCPESFKEFATELLNHLFKRIKTTKNDNKVCSGYEEAIPGTSQDKVKKPNFKGIFYELSEEHIVNRIQQQDLNIEPFHLNDIEVPIRFIPTPEDNFCFYHALAYGQAFFTDSHELDGKRVFHEITTLFRDIMENNTELTDTLNQVLGENDGSLEDIAARAFVELPGFQLWGHTGMLPFIAWWYQMPIAVVTRHSWSSDGSAMLFSAQGRWELLVAVSSGTIEQQLRKKDAAATSSGRKLLILEHHENHWSALDLHTQATILVDHQPSTSRNETRTTFLQNEPSSHEVTLGDELFEGQYDPNTHCFDTPCTSSCIKFDASGLPTTE